jgi:putative transposase
MARPLRYFVDGLTLHVIQRGNNRGLMFRAPSDYEVFLFTLRQASGRYGIRIHAYVLMNNHFHLMVTPEAKSSLSLAMQSVGRRYVRFFNDRYKRTGGLWEGRHKVAFVQDDQYWLTCMRYVELNPVRAGLVSSPELYKWSSYRAHALGSRDLLLSEHEVFTGLGGCHESRQLAWRGMCDSPLSPQQLQRIRGSICRGAVEGEPFFHESAAI